MKYIHIQCNISMRKYNHQPYPSFITENYFIHRKVSQNIP
ncbi:hypothetical protein HMPREF1621_00279 [Escherichia coli A25922R]|nr:hypothetical protein HMPREF9544_00160 [Escherichia coli MS 153-1]ESD02634.1 hypothetical protein HMPREF1593_00119 [Escherichia coli 907391]ESD17398.1 hypothetical protein HMPREF1596_00036 [Escherichia coli 907700]ESD30603.1 hypothetical protein HMPREF1603_05301 [Escherichia coli 907892]ESD63652.1 hypothetical protein HMPREF1607_00172 [Escherichia coli 908524]ESE02129.1 hypothetical protein HMPREF1614_01553 [Escherichia coli 908624]ESE30197.1 hypothetical protein HMPREF1622_03912 [Escherich